MQINPATLVPITNEFSIQGGRPFHLFQEVIKHAGTPMEQRLKKYVMDVCGNTIKRRNGNPRWVHAINVATYVQNMRIWY